MFNFLNKRSFVPLAVIVMLVGGSLACDLSADEQAEIQSLEATRVALAITQTTMAQQQRQQPAAQQSAQEAQAQAAQDQPQPQPQPQPEQPQQAPTTPPKVSYEEISFSFDDSIASGVTPSNVAAEDYEYWGTPAYIRFDFNGYAQQNTSFEPHIAVYPVAAYETMSEAVPEEIAALRSLLANHPISPETPYPFLPLWNASQVFSAHFAYLDFQNGNGIRYLVQYAQSDWPINNKDLFYTYQGLTADGNYYVSATLPVSTSVLPNSGEEVQIDDWLAWGDNFLNYVEETRVTVNAQSPDSFTPPLNMLDEMIKTLRVK